MAYPHAASWGSGGPRRSIGPSRSSGRWGHHAPQILIGAVLATVLLAAVPAPATSPMAALAPALLLGVVLATWVHLRRHDRGLCEHCVRSMPLNPSEVAQRHRHRLVVAHLGARRRVAVAYVVVLLGSDVALVAVPTGALPVAMTLWALVQSTMVYLVLSHVTHRRLQPWCPQCTGGGGREQHDDHRDPEPSGSRSR